MVKRNEEIKRMQCERSSHNENKVLRSRKQSFLEVNETLFRRNEELNNEYFFLKERYELEEQNRELKRKIKEIQNKKINDLIRGVKKWFQ